MRVGAIRGHALTVLIGTPWKPPARTKWPRKRMVAPRPTSPAVRAVSISGPPVACALMLRVQPSTTPQPLFPAPLMLRHPELSGVRLRLCCIRCSPERPPHLPFCTAHPSPQSSSAKNVRGRSSRPRRRTQIFGPSHQTLPERLWLGWVNYATRSVSTFPALSHLPVWAGRHPHFAHSTHENDQKERRKADW